MTLESADKTFFVNRLVLVSTITALVAIALLLAGFRYISRSKIEGAQGPKGGGSGDTPVVLVGDSVHFKAPVSNQTWQTTTAQQIYYVTPSPLIETIAIKTDSSQPEGDPDTDKMSLGVGGGGQKWEVDESAFDNSGATPGPTIIVASIAYQQGGNVILTLKDPSGYLCPTSSTPPVTEIIYGRKADCSDFKHFKLAQVALSATASDNSQASGTFICDDTPPTKGTCKIAFRGPLQ